MPGVWQEDPEVRVYRDVRLGHERRRDQHVHCEPRVDVRQNDTEESALVQKAGRGHTYGSNTTFSTVPDVLKRGLLVLAADGIGVAEISWFARSRIFVESQIWTG